MHACTQEAQQVALMTVRVSKRCYKLLSSAQHCSLISAHFGNSLSYVRLQGTKTFWSCCDFEGRKSALSDPYVCWQGYSSALNTEPPPAELLCDQKAE